MAFNTATVEQCDLSKDTVGVHVAIKYAGSGETPVVKDYGQVPLASFSKRWMRQTATLELAALNATKTDLPLVPKGTVLDTTPDAPPSQAELDRVAWFALLGQYQSVAAAVALGVIPAAGDANVAALKASIVSGFKAGYVNKF